jgi:hypothetical protein
MLKGLPWGGWDGVSVRRIPEAVCAWPSWLLVVPAGAAIERLAHRVGRSIAPASSVLVLMGGFTIQLALVCTGHTPCRTHRVQEEMP